MRLKLYKESTLDTQVSDSGEFENSDETVALDGVSGESETIDLWVAGEQTTLAAVCSSAATALSLTAARFSGDEYLVVRCEAEKMLITAGAGTTSPTVTRGYDGTTAAEHASGTRIYAAYDYSAIRIAAADDTGTDESAMISYRLDGGVSFAVSLSLGVIHYNQSKKIQRKITVSAGAGAAVKTDILHRLSAELMELEA